MWKIKLAAIAVGAALCFASGYRFKSVFVEAEYAEKLEDAIKEKSKAEAEALKENERLRGQLATIKKNTKQNNRKVSDEISKNSAYSACRIPDDGLRVLNEAIANKGTPAR